MPPLIRRGTSADARACHDLMWASITDFAVRVGSPLEGTADDWWSGGEYTHRYLAEHAAEWWIAEGESEQEIVGYARSIARGGLLELTEFFVKPGRQSAGLGRELIQRAFPTGGWEVRSIIATGDVRALARYYGAGTVVQFAIITLGGTPRAGESEGGLTPVRLNATDDLREVMEIERAVVTFGRGEQELRWLVANREGYIYRRGDRGVGLAFIAKDGAGPIAALDPDDLPDILLHLEGRSTELGVAQLEFEVPSVNGVAVRHLLARGFKFNPWINYFMADRPFGQFDHYICFSPPIFL